MAERTLMSFDWAIKKVLRHKENFDVLEGFLSELLGFDVVIVQILADESSNNGINMLAKTQEQSVLLIGIQLDWVLNPLPIQPFAKVITDWMRKEPSIQKSYFIHIRRGCDETKVREYSDIFRRFHQKETLQLTQDEKRLHSTQNATEIFPQYYFVHIGSEETDSFNEPIDEWLYFLKTNRVKDAFTAKGMSRAQNVLSKGHLTDEELRVYQRYIENRRIERAVLETAYENGLRKVNCEIAQRAVQLGLSHEMVAQLSKLSLEEIASLAAGKSIDIPVDEE